MTDVLFTVRACVLEDALVIDSFEQQAVIEGRNYRGFSQLLRDAPLVGGELPAILNSTDQYVLIIDHHGDAQGFAHVDIHREVATIRRIYITTNARNLGAGSMLLHAAREEAKRRGCKQVDAIALPGDRLTKNLYERANMKARLLIASSEL